MFLKYLEGNPIGRNCANPGLILSKYSGVIPDLVFYSHARGKEIIANDRFERGSGNRDRDSFARPREHFARSSCQATALRQAFRQRILDRRF